MTADKLPPIGERHAHLPALAGRGYQPRTPVQLHDAGFGWHLILDMERCDPEFIDDADTLRTWVTRLVDQIGMVAYGQPVIEHFGHADPVTAGYTVVQLIETSSITAHLSPHRGTAHIDVFSCRWFSPVTVVSVTEAHLGGRGGHATLIARG